MLPAAALNVNAAPFVPRFLPGFPAVSLESSHFDPIPFQSNGVATFPETQFGGPHHNSWEGGSGAFDFEPLVNFHLLDSAIVALWDDPVDFPPFAPPQSIESVPLENSRNSADMAFQWTPIWSDAFKAARQEKRRPNQQQQNVVKLLHIQPERATICDLARLESLAKDLLAAIESTDGPQKC